MNYPDYEIVQECLLQIENQLNWGVSESWHNNVYIELSEKIQDKTHILLSPTTLKRVWGRVNYTNAPSITTLNTLAQFAGYSNWRAFKNHVIIKESSWFEREITPKLGVIVVSAAIMTVVFISFYSMIGVKGELPELDVSKVKFKSTSVSTGLPNTVVFDFDLEEIDSDSLRIQQFWDPTKTINIKKGQTQATGQYYYPGFFRAKLLVDGTIIKEHDLFIESEGWLGTIGYEPIPKYVKEQVLNERKLSFQKHILNEIINSDQPLISTFHRVEKFNVISGDNFELNSTLRNIYRDKWAVCQTTRIVILGTKSALIVPFSIPGCVSEIGVMLSDKFISGKENDLSSLGINLSSFRNIQLRVVDKELTVIVDDTTLFSNNYSESIGEIVGVRFQFLGAGEVSNLSIRSLDASVTILNEGFE